MVTLVTYQPPNGTAGTAAHVHRPGRADGVGQPLVHSWRLADSAAVPMVLRTGTTSSANTPISLSQQFEVLVEIWRNETGMYSMDTRKVSHPAYLRIISMSHQAIPLILNELRERGGHWYQALEAILGYNPIRIAGTVSIRELKEKWLDWGRQQGYIS